MSDGFDSLSEEDAKLLISLLMEGMEEIIDQRVDEMAMHRETSEREFELPTTHQEDTEPRAFY